MLCSPIVAAGIAKLVGIWFLRYCLYLGIIDALLLHYMNLRYNQFIIYLLPTSFHGLFCGWWMLIFDIRYCFKELRAQHSR